MKPERSRNYWRSLKPRAVRTGLRSFGLILTGPALILALLWSIAGPTPALAANRGVDVTAKTVDGQTLKLYRNSYALLIGVSRYRHWPTLEQVPAEVTSVRQVLEKQGFEVITRMDPDGETLESTFESFIDKYGYNPQNRLLFYYAGHGYTLRGGDNGYLVPVDAPDPRKDEIGFKRAALDMNNDILAGCRKMDARHALFLFDSCFSGTIFKQRDLPAAPPAISRMTALPVRQFITAGTAGEAVPAKSTFTPAFVDALEHGLGDLNRDGYVSGTELGLYLQREVPRHVRQTPQYGKINDYDLSRGDFIFLAGGSTLVTQPTQTTTGSGTLRIEAEPSGAQVSVNNEAKGATPLQLSGLSPGTYRVQATKAGYAPKSRKVTVRAGRVATVRFYLDPIRQTGRLYVHPEPADAKVRLINITSPYHEGMELEAGRYQVQVEKPGYETVTRWEELKANEDLVVHISLEKVAAASSGGGKAFTNSLGMTFVYIKPGSFIMGSPSSEPGRNEDERQHRVTLTSGFYMQTTEVTQGQWKAVMGSNPSHFSNCGDNCPVETVSWTDVQAFIGKLNQRVKKYEYRLPTEAEWEYACRAGTTGPFNTGNCLSTAQANYDSNHPLPGCSKGQYREKTVPVTSFSPNAWGLYNMHGNVWEWCQDWYGNYPAGSVTDPVGPSSGSYRVRRGGGWSSYAQYCRAAYHGRYVPVYRGNYLGFRLVLSPAR